MCSENAAQLHTLAQRGLQGQVLYNEAKQNKKMGVATHIHYPSTQELEAYSRGTQLVGCLPSMHKALGSFPKTT